MKIVERRKDGQNVSELHMAGVRYAETLLYVMIHLHVIYHTRVTSGEIEEPCINTSP